ncbi:MAG: SDR family NAD(P)-dependent oxidoreductase [Nitrososphaeraceae archaeon]|nr:SDR family NAD(P)-dependent oxidoreductase [Nitrososphaeraceae archaeon]MDW0185323.1 SDR family NAD(P)-dependent oxidoreductase [Nitrososphaeraceae archaeon]MDW0201385.1 SDR family NAD(P)-dependent oxidoreductase [Nitrososphaeraceae archaeon]MDW0284771.1 SDR family NAD(P)-dependent oxidoreductase [Nitrososphaeraceae archaeon]
MSTIYTALVTGSGRGIGKETAILLSKKGFNLIICSRNQNEIDSVVKEIKSFGNDRILARECDVSVSSQVNSRKVAEKIADMIFSDKEYPNGVSVDLRS